eukprot:scaffold10478_cov114-Isochrysis_galbana.AAC.4
MLLISHLSETRRPRAYRDLASSILAFSRAHIAVARLRSDTRPSAAHRSITSLVGLNWVKIPYSDAA